jgi:hypothetical protein
MLQQLVDMLTRHTPAAASTAAQSCIVVPATRYSSIAWLWGLLQVIGEAVCFEDALPCGGSMSYDYLFNWPSLCALLLYQGDKNAGH